MSVSIALMVSIVSFLIQLSFYFRALPQLSLLSSFGASGLAGIYLCSQVFPLSNLLIRVHRLLQA